MNDIEYRSATTTLEVRHAQRVIDLIAVPYNEPAEVFRKQQRRWVMETVDPDAFAGVSGDVTVNRSHDRDRPLGRVATFHPKDPRGLRAELRISRTREGDDVLELAEDGLLSPSVGFMSLAEQWTQDRSAVRVTKAQLVHIGLTGDPAYKGAKVLAVRSASDDDAGVRIATPNLDRIRLELLAERSGFTLTGQ